MGRHTIIFLAMALLGANGLVGSLCAQPVPVVPATHVGEGSRGAMPPPVPQIVSPVDQFRQLLALAPAQREARLTNRPPELRRRILAKLQEYDAMKSDERELRLRSTQVRWYMLSLMESPPGDRAKRLEVIPEPDRQVVRDHLAEWDRLAEDERKEVLKYEKVIENLVAQGFTNAATTTNIIGTPPAYRNLDTFLKLPADQRQQMYDSFQKFFELSDADKQKTLGALSPAERAQIEAALRRFAQLPKPRRDVCLKSFSKFSNMNDAERQEFLQSAERWRELSPAERRAWSDLVNRLPKRPPLPPGLAVPPPPLPSLPAHRPPLQVSISGTNSTQ